MFLMSTFCLFDRRGSSLNFPPRMDAKVNAEKTDLLLGKPGGLFAVWDHIVPHHYRKRLVPERSNQAEHHKHNYLHSWYLPGEWSQDSGLSKTRFHRGFKRRMLPESHVLRDTIADAAFSKFNANTAARIANYHSNSRNVITSVGVHDLPRLGRRTDLESQFSTNRECLAKKRVAECSARFHGPPRTMTAPIFHPCESLLVTKSMSKHNRARSVGVLDNFTHTQLPLLPL